MFKLISVVCISLCLLSCSEPEFHDDLKDYYYPTVKTNKNLYYKYEVSYNEGKNSSDYYIVMEALGDSRFSLSGHNEDLIMIDSSILKSTDQGIKLMEYYMGIEDSLIRVNLKPSLGYVWQSSIGHISDMEYNLDYTYLNKEQHLDRKYSGYFRGKELLDKPFNNEDEYVIIQIDGKTRVTEKGNPYPNSFETTSILKDLKNIGLYEIYQSQDGDESITTLVKILTESEWRRLKSHR